MEEDVVRETEDEKDEVVKELSLEIEVEADEAVDFAEVVVEDGELATEVVGATTSGRVEDVAVGVNEGVVLMLEATEEVEAN